LCCAAEIKEHIISVFENRVMREVYVSRREVKKIGENCTVRSYIICTPEQILG
jgi:hypothetical protein